MKIKLQSLTNNDIILIIASINFLFKNENKSYRYKAWFSEPIKQEMQEMIMRTDFILVILDCLTLFFKCVNISKIKVREIST